MNRGSESVIVSDYEMHPEPDVDAMPDVDADVGVDIKVEDLETGVKSEMEEERKLTK
jgi:hypothetical protein